MMLIDIFEHDGKMVVHTIENDAVTTTRLKFAVSA